MKILILSDSHGNIANLKAVMEIAKKTGIKTVVHCGDWDNVESVKTVLSYGISLYTVLGNADVEEGIEDYLKFNAKKFDPYFLKFKLDGKRIGITHRIKKDDFDAPNLDIVFYGDTHSKDEKIINWTKFVRPGALINGINFAIYETANGEVEYMNSNI